jgi:formylglycine-generating enzyme required for sulfatase activity
LAETQAELKEVEKGPQVEDPHSAWMCGPRPPNRVFNLPGGERIEMVGIPCGSFVMGTPLPDMTWFGDVVGHKVTLTEAFWMGKFPVTVAQGRILLPDAAGRKLFTEAFSDIQLDKWDDNWDDDLLTWEDARKITDEMNRLFGDSLPDGYRFALPTEAQWEYACRAGTVGAYNNGKGATLEKRTVTSSKGKTRTVDMFSAVCENLDEVGWYSGNSNLKRHKVGQKKPNLWGLYDMHGLCSEWCQDYYSDKLEKTSINMIDPRGPISGDSHVKRGGGYGFQPEYNTSYHRMSGGVYPRTPKLNRALWGKPQVGSMRLAIVKDVPEAIDVSDTKLYGKNYLTTYDWQTNQIAQIDKRDKAVFEPIQRKAALLPLVKFTLEAFEVAQPVIEVYVNERIERAHCGKGKKSRKSPQTGVDGNDAATGFGTIKGPSSLTYNTAHNNGQWAKYSLYVGGKNVSDNATWSSAGTSITVSSSGRAMAGNPPVGNGKSFKTGIRATYNGKSYTKSITIMKR